MKRTLCAALAAAMLLGLGVTAQAAGRPALSSGAWPLYKRITARRREKLAPSILHLTDELMR